MRRLVLTVLLVLGFAVQALAVNENCTVTVQTQPHIWDAVTDNIGDCTEGADDDYIIGAGATVIVRGDSVDLTTGSIIVSGGTLIVDPGAVLQYGDGSAGNNNLGFDMTSGTVEAIGTLMQTCNVVSTDHTTHVDRVGLTLDCDIDSNVTTTDWVVMGDDFPDNPGNMSNSSFMLGAGLDPGPGVYKPMYNALSWYKVQGTSGSTVTVTLSSAESFTENPYAGTRDNPTQSGALDMDSTDIDTVVLDPSGTFTEVTVSAANYGEEVCTMNGDLGSYYLSFVENPASGNGEPDECLGEAYKILGCNNGTAADTFTDANITAADDTITVTTHPFGAGDVVQVTTSGGLPGGISASTDYVVHIVDANTIKLTVPGASPVDETNVLNLVADGSGTHTLTNIHGVDDTLIVSGDVTNCLDGDAHITHGVRRGDIVHIVRPATFDGSGGGTDGGMAFRGGTMNSEWVTFQAIGWTAAGSAAFSPVLQRNFNIAFVQGGTAGSVTNPSGYMRHYNIFMPNNEDSGAFSDTGVLEITSNTTSTAHRFASDGLLDMGGMEFSRGHIHDAANDDATSCWGDPTGPTASTCGAGGTHGIALGSVDNLELKYTRVERLTDDGVVALVTAGATTLLSDIKIKGLFSYEQASPIDNSQQGVDVGIYASNGAGRTDADSDQLSHGFGWLSISDAVVAGVYDGGLFTLGGGISVDRAVVGRVVNAEAWATNTYTSADTPALSDFTDEHFGRFKDSYLHMSGTHTSDPANFNSEILSSLMVGNTADLDNDTTRRLTGYCKISESVIDLGVGGATAMIVAGSSIQSNCEEYDFEDTFFRSSNAGGSHALIDNIEGTVSIAPKFKLRRVFQAHGEATTSGPLNTLVDDANVTYDVIGYRNSYIAGSDGNDRVRINVLGTNTNFSDVCAETFWEDLEGTTSVFGETLPATTARILTADTSHPKGDEPYRLRSITENYSTTSVCTRAWPKRLGFSTAGIGLVHGLADGYLKSYERFSSDLDLNVSRGSSAGGRAVGSGSKAF